MIAVGMVLTSTSYAVTQLRSYAVTQLRNYPDIIGPQF